MNDLAGKHIVLGLTGGIACYKAAELCRALVKEGATVQVVMTEASEQFITPVTMQALSGRPVYTSQWDAREPNNMPHINLSREADAILVAPCSADFMAKLLHGRADESMNVSGRKVGPAELEEILCMHPAVSEAAVIGVPDELKGEEIVAFVVLKKAGLHDKIAADAVTEHLIKQMGSAFRPKRVHIVAEVPKTQSGKIMRRLIRERYLGRELSDTSSLADASVLEAFRGLSAESQ